jgi:hypothetical protein
MSVEIPIENSLIQGYALFPMLFNVIFNFAFEFTIRKAEEILCSQLITVVSMGKCQEKVTQKINSENCKIKKYIYIHYCL